MKRQVKVLKQHFRVGKITSLLLIGLLVFLYLIVNTIAELYVATTNPLAGLHFHFEEPKGRIVIYGVTSGSAAEEAGLQTDDEVVTINDKPISNLRDFVWTIFRLETGKLVRIEALRDGTPVKWSFISQAWINAKLIIWSLLPGLLFGYALCLIGTFVLLKRVQDRGAHIFFLMCIFWALAMRQAFPQGHILHNALPLWLTDLFVLPAWPLATGLLLHFHLIFPVENETFQRRPKLYLSLVYAPLILVIPHTYGLANNLLWAEPFLRIAWGIWLSVYFILALWILGRSVIRPPNPHIQKQTEIMFYGTILSLFVPMVLYFLPSLLLGRSFPYAEFTGVLIILWPVTLAYTIIKHRFMDIDFIIKRGLAYALISSFVVAAYFLFVVGAGQLFLKITDANNQVVTILATLLIAALFNPVKNRIQSFVERRFYPSKFTYREAVQSFGHELVNVLDLDRLLAILTAFLSQTMKIRPVTVYWREPKEDRYQAIQNEGVELEMLPDFSDADKVIDSLQIKKELIDLSPLKEEQTLITETELAKWQELSAEMTLPLLTKGMMVGFLSLGPKEDDEPYFKEDLELLQSLNDRINISLDNAMLTEELREQDRLKRELEVARRIQISSLPLRDPDVPGLDISGVSIPALEVGGDYYDYLDFAAGKFGVVVGDVSGKGTSAALYMAQLKGILNAASKYQQSLVELMVQVNAITYKSLERQFFITLTCGVFDLTSRNFKMVRAGHLPLIHYSAKKKCCTELVPGGIGVGLENGTIFRSQLEEEAIEFNSGDLFLFFSDGLTEARNATGQELEDGFLTNLIEENGCHNAVSLREKIISRVQEFSGSSTQHDDMTLVVVRAK